MNKSLSTRSASQPGDDQQRTAREYLDALKAVREALDIPYAAT
jgi:hypothetical protein